MIASLLSRENIAVTLLAFISFLGIAGVPQLVGITADTIILAGIGVIATSILTDRIGHWKKVEDLVVSLDKRVKPSSALDRLLMERGMSVPFSELLNSGDEFWISAKGLKGFLDRYGRQIVTAAKAGKRFRFLTHDPDNAHLSYAVSSNSYSNTIPARQSEIVRSSLAKLVEMRDEAPPGSIEARLVDAPIYNGYTIIRRTSGPQRAYIEFFGYKISQDERLTITIDSHENGRFYKYHEAQYEALWKSGVDPFREPILVLGVTKLIEGIDARPESES